MVLEFLFKRKSVELATQSELAVDFLLADVEVLDVEETLGVKLAQAEDTIQTTYQHAEQRGPAARRVIPCRLADHIGSGRG